MSNRNSNDDNYTQESDEYFAFTQFQKNTKQNGEIDQKAVYKIVFRMVFWTVLILAVTLLFIIGTIFGK